VPMMLAALSTYHAGMSQVVIAGDPAAAETIALTDVVRRRYLPFAVVVPLSGRPQPKDGAIARILPSAHAIVQSVSKPTAYVCRDFTCLAPVTSADALASQLG